MAYTDYLLRYRAKDTAALEALRTALEARETTIVSQSMGTKSITRDLRMLQDQLNAIAYVLKERGATVIVKPVINHGIGVVDFSQIQ